MEGSTRKYLQLTREILTKFSVRKERRVKGVSGNGSWEGGNGSRESQILEARASDEGRTVPRHTKGTQKGQGTRKNKEDIGLKERLFIGTRSL
ncbi:hypothetical protein FOC4_g10012423 [Fusarium odoratissimum]|uniref:Uncharacterized protein n=1 Tax=Fusarium oxysporum f. sp. cubense (strain race 4) TaxID=2502994 RepID=N1S0H7_FUSC4|nr:hypothetical protein FOC4_g10012421 [Fusarium odoratissimum]EMT68022.1 hypothetical protein FOC4_g10012423 [Fusarium odoratissimum]